jgi:hypothetical protein
LRLAEKAPYQGSTMSDEELKADLGRLRAENAALKKGASSADWLFFDKAYAQKVLMNRRSL